MGREVRRVPADWEHPKDYKGHYKPLLGRSFAKDVSDWDRDHAMWLAGYRKDYTVEWATFIRPRDGEEIPRPEGLIAYVPITDEDLEGGGDYSDYHGARPFRDEYMPDWPEVEHTHWQMYEDTTEGTPISPVCETPEELARWLADNKASAFGSMTASYDQWLGMIGHGSAPSMILTTGGGDPPAMQSGVEFVGESA